jgi:hypothetical protein
LIACQLTAEFGYLDGGAVSGRYHTGEPFPVSIDLEKIMNDRVVM